jgi:hypothetical protein
MEPIPEELLNRLQEPDERALVFNPLGMGGRMPPGQAARFQAATIESARLVEDVPEGIRDYWHRVWRLHQHGVLEYEFFSAAADLALLALEGALRRRFVDFYEGRIPVAGRRGATKGAEAVLLVERFERVWEASRNWNLATPGELQQPLPTSLAPLLAWARRTKLLPGRRSRRVDQSLLNLRNWAAHPEDYTLDYPPSVARGICQVAEYINMLWGYPTPNGQTFKTHVHRRPRAVGLSPTGEASVELRPDQASMLAPEYSAYIFSVLLAADDELHLTRPAMGPDAAIEIAHRPGFQETQFPCDLLFEGDYDALLSAVALGAFDDLEDEAPWLDRLFLIREAANELDHPRSAVDVLALKVGIGGSWRAIVADGPWDAYQHIRDHGHAELADDGTCPECSVAELETVVGWPSVAQLCEQTLLMERSSRVE